MLHLKCKLGQKFCVAIFGNLRVIGFLSLGACIPFLEPLTAYGQNVFFAQSKDETLHIRWLIPRSHVAIIKKSTKFEGLIVPALHELRDQKGLPLLYEFTGAIPIYDLADALIEVCRYGECEGLVISIERHTIHIEVDGALPRGSIVVSRSAEIKYFDRIITKSRAELLRLLRSLKEVE